MENGYHLNIAIRTSELAWDSQHHYRLTHYARVFLGNDSPARAQEKAADFRRRFPEGDRPGQFSLMLTHWQATGTDVQF